MVSTPSITDFAKMQLSSELRGKWALFAAVGAGCLVGASGILLLQRIGSKFDDVDRSAQGPRGVSKELSTLHVSIRHLQEAIQELKDAQAQALQRRPVLKNKTVTFSDVEKNFREKEKREQIAEEESSHFYTGVGSSSNTTDFFSAISSDDEQEFFDVEDFDEETGANGSVCSGSDEILELFREVDELMDGGGKEQMAAMDRLREKEEEGELNSNAEFLWRLCKAIYLTAILKGLQGDSKAKYDMIVRAAEYGEKAIKCNPESSEAHKWYAIVVGSRAEFVGIKEKILDGYTFKEHVDRAAELSPHDHTIQHLLGRFCYEVAELSWFERKAAATLFAEPPSATMSEARNHFEAAERLKPQGWKENRLFLAKTCIKMQEFEDATRWLKKAQELPIRNTDDKIAQDSIGELLTQYENC